MTRTLLGLCCAATLSLTTLHAETTIYGFENKAVFDRVMAGEVVTEPVSSTNADFHHVFRAFFKNGTSDQFARLATDYENYPSMFEEVSEARTVTANSDRTHFTYLVDFLVGVGFFKVHVKPEGWVTYHRAPDAVSEAYLDHELTNYQDVAVKSHQHTRLIPYQGGLLVHDETRFQLTNSAYVETVKAKFLEGMPRYLATFRDKLAK